MRSFIKFFLENPAFNHTLFVVSFILGIWAYQDMPKEMFPVTESDTVVIKGGYTGASINTLDKIVVADLESNVLGMEQVKEINTVISPSSFSIVATLKDHVNKKEALDDIETFIKKSKQNLPSDMNDPTAYVIKMTRPILYIGLGANEDITKKQQIDKADEIKNKLSTISGVSDVDVFGNNDSIIEFILKEKVIAAYGLDISAVMSTISALSYTFPLGDIKDNKDGYYYLTMNNGNKSKKEFENTILKIGSKEIYLKEIVSVQETFKEDSSKAFVNGKKSIILTVNQLSSANAIEVVKNLKETVKQLNIQNPDYELTTYNDRSIPIKKRLNIVFSNIMFGMILVVLALYLLINRKLSIIIGLGIPTSFVLAFIVADNAGMSINIVSLLGLLIALGIVVDDAIVVGENIQRHIENGEDKKTSALNGVMEVLGPVSMASLTTLFAFIPMLLIGGEMGKLIMLIPIMVSLLLVASLIEVFIFLPIHAEHMLDKHDKAVSWEWINQWYEKLLIKTIHFKKTFLVLFFILVPLFTVLIIKHSSFQMFPAFDTSEFKISGKFDKDHNLDNTEVDLKSINQYLVDNKNKYKLASFTTKVGVRDTVSGVKESGENMFSIDVELEETMPANVFEKYINPLFTLADIDKGSREETSMQIAKELFMNLKTLPVSQKISEFMIIERKVGPVKTDIHLAIKTDEQKQLMTVIDKLKEELHSIRGVKNVSDDLTLGVPELRLKINKYGEELGLTEQGLGRMLSNIYLENKKFNIFTKKEMIEVNFVSKYEDNLKEFKTKEITLPNGKMIRLDEVVSFEEVPSFLKVVKIDGIITKNVYANVDTTFITATEVLNKLQSTIESLQNNEIKIEQRGENKEKKELAKDMKKAVFLTLFLIILSMLYMFKKFSYTFIIVSVIPFSVIGALLGHLVMGLNLTMPSIIGILGLAGVVINDAILMLSFVEKTKNVDEFLEGAKIRFRPIMLTSITTLLGLVTLIFFATGQAVILQPIAVSLGFGLAWGTIINLFYVPALYALINKYKK
jgi:multidrug efflux pump subunit AcrB